jgi:L-amino acid N-acyltransferase YncA
VGEVVIRDAVESDVPAITSILNALLTTTTYEWRDEPHSVDQRALWLQGQQAGGRPVLVAVDAGAVVGWASYGDFRDASARPGYRYTVEHSVHVRETHTGRGIGRALVEALMVRAAAAGMHVMVAATDGSNERSIRFHERLGFTVVAVMPETGAKHGQWLDLVLLQRRLDDRRAPPG